MAASSRPIVRLRHDSRWLTRSLNDHSPIGPGSAILVAGTAAASDDHAADAPKERVYQAYLDPKLIVQWLGPRQYTMRLDRWEAHAGGAYRYVHSTRR